MKKNEQPLNQVLKQFLNTGKIKEKYLAVRIQEAWSKQMGPAISKYTGPITFKRGVLSVQIFSAPLKEELLYGKEKIINLLNEHLEEEVIKGIRIY
jgi:hypothetical protein